MLKCTSIAASLLLPLCASAGNWGLRLDALSWTGNIHGVVIGDSRPALSGGAPFAAALSNAANALTPPVPWKVRNYSIGGSRWLAAEGSPTLGMEWQLASALSNNSPQWVYVQVGFNDLSNHPECFDSGLQVYPCYWPTISAVLQRMMTNIAAVNSRLYVGELWPSYTNFQAFGYPGVHLLNAALNNWTRTNQFASRTFYMAGDRDVLATNNPTTGQLDWMQPIYMLNPPADQVHVNQLGIDVAGTNLVRISAGFFRDPLAIGGVPIRRVNTNAP